MQAKDIVLLLICVAGCLLIGFAGSYFTSQSIPTWYQGLSKPFFSPPNWLFGPVWTILYIMMGLALYLVVKQGLKSANVRSTVFIFMLQLLLNLLWSVLFFGFQSPIAAFIEIVFLWVFILITIIAFRKISKPAGYLLVPYNIWVLFASLLNLSIVFLNK